MDLRGKGVKLGEDVVQLIKKQQDGHTFIRNWSLDVFRVVNNFVIDAEEIANAYADNSIGQSETQERMKTLNTKVFMFCSAFV
jgi:hypothetical protein